MCFPERSCRNNNIFVVSNDFTGSFKDNMKGDATQQAHTQKKASGENLEAFQFKFEDLIIFPVSRYEDRLPTLRRQGNFRK